MATRLLAGFSGSDLYINLNSIDDVQNLYHSIMDGAITNVNSEPVTPDHANARAYFTIIDPRLGKSFDMHIKKQSDGYWFRLTNYIKYQKTLPGNLILLNIDFFNTDCNISIQTSDLYKYVLERHPRERQYYRIISDNPPENRVTITQNTESYLEQFNIIATHNNSLKWSHDFCFSYLAENFSKKYIGVPYSNDNEISCDEFDRVEEII